MVAFVAMLLVAVGGSSRVTQSRVIAGAGQATSDPHPVRHAAVVAQAHSDELQLHLDLSSTPPAPFTLDLTTVVTPSSTDVTASVDAATVTPTGRAPPTP